MILCYFLTDICVNGEDDSSMPQGRKKYNIMIVQYVIFSLTQRVVKKVKMIQHQVRSLSTSITRLHDKVGRAYSHP